MKKLVPFIAIGFLIAVISCSTTKAISKQEQNMLNKVIEKVSSMQKIIGFTNEKAQKLQKLEFDYLKQVKSLQKTQLIKEKLQQKMQELNKQRDTKLQSILRRDEYLKYDAIENDRLKKGIIMAD
ncbi:MAG: hypothetical protein KGV44_06980 [Flavobacteriaceae bacterium]|nr:hypothetical protein [Flavobacteriaceae bacterium]